MTRQTLFSMTLLALLAGFLILWWWFHRPSSPRPQPAAGAGAWRGVVGFLRMKALGLIASLIAGILAGLLLIGLFAGCI